jgi:hypothetical protein
VNGVKGHGAQNTTFVIEIDSQRPHANQKMYAERALKKS